MRGPAGATKLCFSTVIRPPDFAADFLNSL